MWAPLAPHTATQPADADVAPFGRLFCPISDTKFQNLEHFCLLKAAASSKRWVNSIIRVQDSAGEVKSLTAAVVKTGCLSNNCN